MRLVTLFLLTAFAASTVGAASYQKTGGTIVDPILSWWHGSNPSTMEPHSYSGANLEPGADLRFAYLYSVDLESVNLTGANLTGAYLRYARLRQADLQFADLTHTNLSGAGLTAVENWVDAIWTDAFYFTNDPPGWHSDMDQAWRDSWGILGVPIGSCPPIRGDYNIGGIVDAADRGCDRTTKQRQPRITPSRKSSYSRGNRGTAISIKPPRTQEKQGRILP